MLKEQVAEMLYADGDGLPVNGWHYLNHISKDIYRAKAQAIINLFKAEVDKLTVIDNEEIREVLARAKRSGNITALRPDIAVKEAQLQHDKKQLLDLMEEV